ncbi:hypothetical protein EG833_05175 [archaeon]|nr:hypothetical protein [archaeon]
MEKDEAMVEKEHELPRKKSDISSVTYTRTQRVCYRIPQVSGDYKGLLSVMNDIISYSQECPWRNTHG